MAGKRDKKGGDIIIRKEEVVEGGHHGGAWKVAYADFVTAMMAFFLLMWLLNATPEDQRKGLADYFSPSNLFSHASSGSGMPFGGHTPFDKGAMVSDRGSVDINMGRRPKIDVPEDGRTEVATDAKGYRNDDSDDQAAHQFDATADQGAGTAAAATGRSEDTEGPGANTAPGTATEVTAETARPSAEVARLAPDAGRLSPDAARLAPDAARLAPDAARRPNEAEIRAEKERQERAAFEQAAQDIRAAVRNDPALSELVKQLTIDMTPEGLRIQILDEERQPMFATGSATPNDRARLLLQKISPVLLKLPESISIAGHTDAAPFPGPGRTNWELSTERANMTRRLLVEAGLPDSRIRSVTGNADRDPLLPADRFAAANRRIAIVVLREALSRPAPGKPVAPAGPTQQ
ncbi:MAG: OmpA family protein [Rhodospirillales bacterium]|nr:OmpA family protein [Rhodospirillales bacterium]